MTEFAGMSSINICRFLEYSYYFNAKLEYLVPSQLCSCCAKISVLNASMVVLGNMLHNFNFFGLSVLYMLLQYYSTVCLKVPLT